MPNKKKKIPNFNSLSMAERMAKVRAAKKKGGARKKKMYGGGWISDLWSGTKRVASNLLSGVNDGLKKTKIISSAIDTVADTLPFGINTGVRYLNDKFVKSRGYGMKRRMRF